MDIIEISSSPEPERRYPRRVAAARTRRRPAPALTGDVIDISDSEPDKGKRADTELSLKNRKATPRHDNNAPAGPSRKTVAARNGPEAGPSKQNGKKPKSGRRAAANAEPLPLFLPNAALDDPDEVPPIEPLSIASPKAPMRQPSPVSVPPEEEELVPACLAQILEIIPDIEPAHAISLIERTCKIKVDKDEDINAGNIAETVLHALFESADYPKVDRKGKGRAVSTGSKRGWDGDGSTGAGSPASKRAKLDREYAWMDETGVDDEIDCGCCFSSYPFDKLIQCPEAHLFCTECMTSYVSNLLGMQDSNIKCMDQSGCEELFTDGELRRFMPSKLLELYEKVRMRKDIESAQLEGLEECPYCEYKVVIENAEEKLLRCENQECGAVTCRTCKKDNHLPRSCKEVEDDKKIDARHVVEEAMTKALMRSCPKCTKAFIKEYGCNKMTCPNCRTLSCYVCRKIITGYDHFQNSPPYTAPKDLSKCPLWEPVEQRHNDEVAAARKVAMEAVKRVNPEVDEQDLAVDLPPAGPAAGPANGQPRVIAHAIPALPAPHHHHHAAVFHGPQAVHAAHQAFPGAIHAQLEQAMLRAQQVFPQNLAPLYNANPVPPLNAGAIGAAAAHPAAGIARPPNRRGLRAQAVPVARRAPARRRKR